MNLEGKVALITGGAGGIGKGIATAMIKHGAKVVIVDINKEAGMSTQRQLSEFGSIHFMEKDISLRESASEIINEALAQFGQLDILVNNAHASRQAPFIETTPQDFELSFHTGFYPTVNLMQAAYEQLKKNKGFVINFASRAGISGQVNQSSYASAKEAIRGLTRTVANEWAKDGINVNLISPIAKTEGVQQWREKFPEQYEKVVSGIPLGRMGDPEKDIGEVAVFLSSESSSYITGQTIMVDGGTLKLT
ncbi:SDR family oxidoreductase [Bacillus aquiflavi]|uniref:SDR family NAD(P)-dependent oxidoreductase n=1 Tax=Bacillus aquiflavi TaxID=2672567 RepID=UPI001CA9087B|nr:SDR family oxidoreductase [Bacillus aquiflavi]UAC48532.1 SDR family oxidoreductase [Bacillus aquiflavi]